MNWRVYCLWNSKPKPFDVFVKKEFGITIPKGKKDVEKMEAMKQAFEEYQKEIDNKNG